MLKSSSNGLGRLKMKKKKAKLLTVGEPRMEAENIKVRGRSRASAQFTSSGSRRSSGVHSSITPTSSRCTRPRSGDDDKVPSWRDVASALMAGAPQMTDYLRLGTLLMPDNSGSEMTSETVHTALSLISLYTDSDEAERGGAFARYKVEKRGGTAVRGVSDSMLETMRRIQLLVEMAAERTIGDTKKVPLLLVIEFIKALCRINNSVKGRDLAARGRRLGLQRSKAMQSLVHAMPRADLAAWAAGSALHALRPLVYLAALMRYGAKSWRPWLLSLLVDVAAEVAAGRPVFRAALARKRQQEQRALAAESRQEEEAAVVCDYEAAAAVREYEAAEAAGAAKGDATARGLAALNCTANNRAELSPSEGGIYTSAVCGGVSDVELAMREEIQRRRGLLLLYLLRPPAFHALLEPLVQLLRRVLARVPVLGSMAGVLLDMLLTLGRYYFYHSGT